MVSSYQDSDFESSIQPKQTKSTLELLIEDYEHLSKQMISLQETIDRANNEYQQVSDKHGQTMDKLQSILNEGLDFYREQAKLAPIKTNNWGSAT